MKDFHEKASSGLMWSVFSQGSSQLVLLASNVVLAHLLTPHDFGLVATAMIFVNFAMVLAEGGFGVAAVQKLDATQEHLSSIYWLNVIVGVFLTAGFWLCAPAIARIYREPDLTFLVRMVALIFTLNAFGSVHPMTLSRRLEFRTLAKSEVASSWIGAAAAVFFALRGWGAVSIAGQAVVTSTVGMLLIWLLSGWRPSLVFSGRAIRELAGVSTGHVFSSIVSYWVRNVDNVLVGYRLGQTELGIYTRAYSVMLFPWSRVTQVISRVMFPSFSLIQHDHARVRALFQRVTRLLALATFPMMLGVFACAENFVGSIFGPQWGEMIPILRILSLVGMLNSITSLYYEVFLSQGRMDLYLRVSLPVQAFQILGIIVGLRWGIIGVAIGYAGTTLITTPVICRFGGGLIGMGALDFFFNLRSLFACAVVMAAGVWAVGLGLPVTGSPWPKLGVQVLTGGVVYVGLLHTFKVQGWLEFLDEGGRRLTALRKPA